MCVLKQLLDSFSKATGLCINFQKSVLVPIHMNETAVQQCVSLLGCRREGFPQTYLGLPLSLTKTRLSTFVPYMAKTDKYLAGWQAALLNPMGRMVLINSVLDSQLVYVMSSLQLLSGFVKKVDNKRRSFLWSGKDSCSDAKCLVAWGNVCSDKSEGGPGRHRSDYKEHLPTPQVATSDLHCLGFFLGRLGQRASLLSHADRGPVW
jgi:hypothetical protein